jgi:hypothetical protein
MPSLAFKISTKYRTGPKKMTWNKAELSSLSAQTKLMPLRYKKILPGREEVRTCIGKNMHPPAILAWG